MSVSTQRSDLGDVPGPALTMQEVVDLLARKGWHSRREHGQWTMVKGNPRGGDFQSTEKPRASVWEALFDCLELVHLDTVEELRRTRDYLTRLVGEHATSERLMKAMREAR